MSAAEITLLALPGVAALIAGTVRWRAWRRGRRAWRRTPPAARLVLALFALGVVASCHSIEEGVFAHGPVPVSDLPLQEPILYSVGPNAGQVVPAQNGLLASYFNGADYVQPSHNEYLHHQQIDPNIDFSWDASDTNPVIPAGDGGIDHNDGDFRLPDHWPIWSIVWEGYLAVPADGTYGLRLHVNNGGWLEMKNSSGGLTTVISCPGGSGFEGDCDGGADLHAGRAYIRISYFNNAPSSANAIFSWQPPAAAAFSVVPTASLFTQSQTAANTAPVLNIGGDASSFRGDGFTRSASFTDPDAGDSWTVTVDYGDGSGVFPLSFGSDKTFTLSRTYTRLGTFTVSVLIADRAGLRDTKSFTVTVKRRPLVYIPGIFGSELSVPAGTTAPAIDNGHGGTFTPSLPGCTLPTFPNPPAVWLNLCEAIKPGDDDFFDALKFGPAGTPVVPQLSTTGQLMKVADPDIFGKGGYEDVEPFFTSAANDGYVEGTDFIVFNYDWRYSPDRYVSGLDDAIAALRSRTGAPRVDVVTHSLGGLVARSFLLSGAQRDHVGHVVMLGALHLGTPMFAYALLGGTCLPLRSTGVSCAITATEVADMSRSVPVGSPIAPSKQYYAIAAANGFPAPYVDDRTGIAPEPPLADDDYPAFVRRELEAGVASAYVTAGEGYHSDDATWFTRLPSGVDLTLVTGSGLLTVGQVRERFRVDIIPIDPFGVRTGVTVNLRTLVDARYVDGDTAVVTQSAALNRSGPLPANVRPIYACGYTHNDLTMDRGLPIALAILRGQDPTSTLHVTQPDPCSETGTAQTDWILSTHSPLEILVTDASGDRIGSVNGTTWFDEIPGARYQRLGDSKFVRLPVGAAYVATFAGTYTGDALVQLRQFAAGQVVTEFVYAHVPTRASARGSLNIDASGAPSALSMDFDGNGTVDRTIPATTLRGGAAQDLVPPDIQILSPDGRNTVGTVQVNWTATDASSGVANSFAVIDRTGAARIVPSPAPVALAAGPHIIDVIAEDRAGNVGLKTTRTTTYGFQWLVPLTANGRYRDAAGRTIPVRFMVQRADGTLVDDASVAISLLDESENTVVGPLVFGNTPAGGVVFHETSGYHSNLSTAGVVAGRYLLRARFNSATLVGDLTLGIDLQ